MGKRTDSGKGVRSERTRLGKFLVRFLWGSIIFVAVAIISGFAFITSSLKAVEPLVSEMGDKIKIHNSKPSRILSADGKELYRNTPLYRESISLSAMPKHLVNAMLAAEDKRYYQHPGVDPTALISAVFNFAKDRGASRGGGSTINMQLAKRLFSDSQKTLSRKIQDISIAIEMEKRYSKDSILEMYMNQVYFGEQAYGIAAAAETYFGKKVKDLSIAEAAMLVRCVRSPSTENPIRDLQASTTNRNIVLKTMLSEGWITQSEYDEAVKEVPKIRKQEAEIGGRIIMAPYFVTGVLRKLREMGIDISGGGYTVHTTLDTELQAQTEAAVRRIVRSYRGMGVNTAAFVCMDNEGRILAEVGGIDFDRNKFSYSRQSKLQPGSAFKPFVYAEALKQGILTEYSTVSNAKLVIRGMGAGGGPYIPRNSHGGYGGEYSLGTAIALSLNIPAVRALQSLGYRRGSELISEDFGFKSKLAPVPSLALGASEVRPLEMAQAYSVFMLSGRRAEPFDIRQVIDDQGEEVYSHSPSITTTRLGSAVCNSMDRLMRGVVTGGTGKRAAVVPEARGKTGTTTKGKSIWFCGYAKGVVGIAWAGSEFYDKKRKQWLLNPMPESYGGDIAAPLWAAVMNPAVRKFGSDVKPEYGNQPEAGEDEARLEEEAEERRERRRRRRERRNDIPEPVVDLAPDREPPTRERPEENGGEDPIRDGDGAPPVVADRDREREKERERETGNAGSGNAGAGNAGGGNSGESRPERERTSGSDRERAREREPERTRPKEREKAESEVSVSVCADTGQLASDYCPSTITRTYARSKRPRSRCRIHKPAEEGGGTGGGQHHRR